MLVRTVLLVRIVMQIRTVMQVRIVGRAKRAPHWGVQSRFRVIYICRYVCRVLCVGGITYAHAQSQFWAVKTDMQHPRYSFRLYARAALAWTQITFT